MAEIRIPNKPIYCFIGGKNDTHVINGNTAPIYLAKAMMLKFCQKVYLMVACATALNTFSIYCGKS